MAGLIYQLIGHQQQKEWLLEQVQRGGLPSAMILQGPHGIGKKFLALALLQVMNCDQDPWACGQCSNCQRVFEEKNELITVLEPDGKKNISVDQVRELHQFLNLQSIKPARFVIINPADKLSVQASNALLKVLEESPEKTHFFLLTERVAGLLPTIRSRSHLLKFTTLTREELLSYKKFQALSLDWSDGRLQIAEELEQEKNQEQLNNSLQFLYSLLCEGSQDWKKVAPWFFNREESRDFTFLIWKQALSKRLHGEGENLDWIPESSQTLTQVYERLEDLKKDISGNMDKVLAIENFYYGLHPRGL
jgi:DNA polymerase-3 subunit delta'